MWSKNSYRIVHIEYMYSDPPPYCMYTLVHLLKVVQDYDKHCAPPRINEYTVQGACPAPLVCSACCIHKTTHIQSYDMHAIKPRL